MCRYLCYKQINKIKILVLFFSNYFFVFTERPGIKDTIVIEKLSERVEASLKLEIGKNHPEDEGLKSTLIEKLTLLRLLSARHVDVLQLFMEDNPHVEFPALHKELFSPDGLDVQ